jgi:hypothetical protein
MELVTKFVTNGKCEVVLFALPVADASKVILLLITLSAQLTFVGTGKRL